MKSMFNSRPLMGQPFGGLPASAYIPEAAIAPTMSPSGSITWPPSVVMPSGPILVETYSPPVVPDQGPSAGVVAAGVGLLGLGVVAYLLSR
jgi:hypothetical protein